MDHTALSYLLQQALAEKKMEEEEKRKEKEVQEMFARLTGEYLRELSQASSSSSRRRRKKRKKKKAPKTSSSRRPRLRGGTMGSYCDSGGSCFTCSAEMDFSEKNFAVFRLPRAILTPHRLETNARAERAVRRVEEGTSAVQLQSYLDEKWCADSMECCSYLRNIQDLLSDGKTARGMGSARQGVNRRRRTREGSEPACV